MIPRHHAFPGAPERSGGIPTGYEIFHHWTAGWAGWLLVRQIEKSVIAQPVKVEGESRWLSVCGSVGC
jgi:hypothetical protein